MPTGGAGLGRGDLPCHGNSVAPKPPKATWIGAPLGGFAVSRKPEGLAIGCGKKSARRLLPCDVTAWHACDTPAMAPRDSAKSPAPCGRRFNNESDPQLSLNS